MEVCEQRVTREDTQEQPLGGSEASTIRQQVTLNCDIVVMKVSADPMESWRWEAPQSCPKLRERARPLDPSTHQSSGHAWRGAIASAKAAPFGLGWLCSVTSPQHWQMAGRNACVSTPSPTPQDEAHKTLAVNIAHLEGFNKYQLCHYYPSAGNAT